MNLPGRTRYGLWVMGNAQALPGRDASLDALPMTHDPLRLLERLDEFEHLLDVSRHLDAPPFAANDSLRIDREGAALDAAHLFTVHIFHLDDVVELAGGLLGVGEQLEREPHLGLEALVRLYAVARHAVDGAAALLELGIEVAELLPLGGATGGVVLGIEVEDDGSALGAGEAESLAAGSGQLEVGCWLV